MPCHGVEAWIIQALNTVMDDDEEIAYGGEEQRSFNDPSTKVSATPDGIYVRWDGTDVETCSMVEIKSVDPRTNWDKLPMARHVTQVNIACGLVRRLSNMLQPEKTRLIYVDASNYNKQVEYVVEYDGGTALENAENRAKKLFEVKKMDFLPAEGAMGSDCTYCPYKTACGAAGEYVTKPKPKQAVLKDLEEVEAEVLVLGRQYISAKTTADSAAQMVKELKKELLVLTEGNEVLEVGGEIKIKTTSIAGRRTLQRDKLEEAYGDLSAFEKVGAPSLRLTVEDISS
jgi:hypothetical protein